MGDQRYGPQPDWEAADEAGKKLALEIGREINVVTKHTKGPEITVDDADGRSWCFRLVSSQLERRRWGSGVWSTVSGGDMLTMSAPELRAIADAIELREPAPTKEQGGSE